MATLADEIPTTTSAGTPMSVSGPASATAVACKAARTSLPHPKGAVVSEASGPNSVPLGASVAAHSKPSLDLSGVSHFAHNNNNNFSLDQTPR